jgi:hypothetical protein
MEIFDLDGSCEVDSEADLLARLRSVRRGADGAFLLSHGGPESLAVHFNGEAAYLYFFPDRDGQHAGFAPYGIWPGERRNVRFLLTDGTEASSINVPWWQLVPVDVVYRAAVEFLHSPSLPASVSWLEL